jgi:hypothetical protein
VLLKYKVSDSQDLPATYNLYVLAVYVLPIFKQPDGLILMHSVEPCLKIIDVLSALETYKVVAAVK